MLEPTFHSTDTHGYTDHLFGMCYLLGFSFQSRLADLPGQRVYKIAKADSYGDLDVLFSGAVDVDLIREQWDQLVRVAASLKNRIAPAHVILERLAGRSPSDKVVPKCWLPWVVSSRPRTSCATSPIRNCVTLYSYN
jgi:TnpA family transposase